jgi:hypothetical protein
MHDAEKMGWKLGDRIALAPTQRTATADAQSFFIKSLNHTLLFLAADETLKTDGILNQVGEKEIRKRKGRENERRQNCLLPHNELQQQMRSRFSSSTLTTLCCSSEQIHQPHCFILCCTLTTDGILNQISYQTK